MSSSASMGGSYIAQTALPAIGILPLSVLWFISLCLARKKRDPARVGVTWMKVTFPFWILALLFFTVNGGLNLYVWFDDTGYLSNRIMNEILRSISHIRATGLFLKNLADIFLLITFVELANGFLLCLKGPGEPSRVRKFGRWAILAWGFVLFAISLGLFGASTSFYVRAYGDFPTDSDDYVSDLLNEQMNLNRLLGALKILLWISTMPTVVLASLVMHKTKHHNILRSGASILLAATILTFIRHVVLMAIYADSVFSNAARSLYRAPSIPPHIFVIVDCFFEFIFGLVVLVLLFSIAVRKRRGLWSQPSPEWNQPAVVYVQPGGQPMPMPMPMQGGVPMQGAPVMQQQQQQPYQQQPYQQQPMQQQGGLPAYLQYAEQQKQQNQQTQQQVGV